MTAIDILKLSCQLSARECHMRPGAIVRMLPEPKQRKRMGEWSRGIVLWAHGHGRGQHHAVFLVSNDAIVQLSAGHYHVGNCHDEWEPVPEEEWTTVERVQSAAATWLPPDWREPDDMEHEPDSFEFALFRALLTPAAEERLFGEDTYRVPMTTYELALEVAEHIDRRVADAVAKSRLGVRYG